MTAEMSLLMWPKYIQNPRKSEGELKSIIYFISISTPNDFWIISFTDITFFFQHML